MKFVSALALSVAMLSFVPAPSADPVEDAPVTLTCATMGDNFQCDEERALSHPSVEIWEENFNLTYITTRTDGTVPVVGEQMLTLQDTEFPSMYHVYSMRFAPMLHV